MRTIKRTSKGVFISDQTPSCRDFRPKALKLYKELLTFIENNPQLKLLFVKRRESEA